MLIEKRAVLFQRSLYLIFSLIGLYTILRVYIKEAWFLYTFIGLTVLFGLMCFIVYRRREKTEVVSITKKQLDSNKYVLYAFMGVYLAHVLLEGMSALSIEINSWIFGPLMIIISFIGVYIQQMTLKKGK